MDAFARALLDPDQPPPPGIRVRTGADSASRFAVYRNNVTVSLIEALAETYPVVRQLVGEAFFAAMAREYARCHPPISPVLAWYGRDFPEFIAGFAPAAVLSYLPDMARLEWAYGCAFHAADASSLPAQALLERAAQPELLARTRLRFAPAVRLIRSAHPVVSLWQAHQVEGEITLSGVDMARAEAALLVRPQSHVLVLPMPAHVAAFLDELMAGEPLGPAFERASASGPLPLPELFSKLLEMGAVVALDPASPQTGEIA
ncbi:DNA-binding domain-containing protein [Thermomonas sp. S9]|uniref:HvfC/BufC N-terminal domain-containing protein n=1 Tax=Thermomonas sp. S9 TaxID=2885203 RepID=UPI00216B4423|nr:DNA-binding domain-containing protein [Thermomonas sp. S9]MCR6496528.1 DNA-binding domain-containing protein [Thermomonas sp. S9]